MEKKYAEIPSIDIFTSNGIQPTIGLDKHVALFDNMNNENPLRHLSDKETNKLWQMTIYFSLEGEAEFSINNNDVCIKAGQILVTHEDCVFKCNYGSENHKYFMFVVYPKTVMELFSDIHLNYNKSKYSYSYNVGDVTPDDMDYFLSLYNSLKDELARPEYKYQVNCMRCFLNVILVYIINKFYTNADMQADPSSRQYDMFCKFMDALNKHADKERSVQYYAKLLGITSKYLSFVCLQYSQKNASTWIDEYVVAKARALQNVHHYNIKRISQELNFISPSSFTRFFKRVTGVPPTK